MGRHRRGDARARALTRSVSHDSCSGSHGAFPTAMARDSRHDARGRSCASGVRQRGAAGRLAGASRRARLRLRARSARVLPARRLPGQGAARRGDLALERIELEDARRRRRVVAARARARGRGLRREAPSADLLRRTGHRLRQAERRSVDARRHQVGHQPRRQSRPVRSPRRGLRQHARAHGGVPAGRTATAAGWSTRGSSTARSGTPCR